MSAPQARPAASRADAGAGARIAIALDGLGARAALQLADDIGDPGRLYKIGPALFTEDGPNVIAALRDRGKQVFLDLKFHDIPQTVASAVAEAARHGVTLLTLHASGGRAMLRAARAAITPGPAAPRLLAVTVLTSLDAALLHEALEPADAQPAALALRLARLARAEAIDGIVCSPLEARALRAALGPEALLVTPGIRARGGAADDQRRTLTAAEAIAEGADILVVGRPIVAAPSPRDAFLAFAAEVEAAAP
ncbi:MAG: orotidine-5'-phosphate decarboxylase [bacterium]